MIELARHIEILLLSNDCVIVPDLGGFMAHHVDARYDKEDCLFLPPLRTLGFNPQLKLNDSLLVQSYIEAYDLSYPEALRRIEDEVNELRQHLEKDGYYEMNDIGVLSMNEEGHLQFEPCEAGILTPGYYGLGTVAIQPLVAMKKAVAEKEASQENHEAAKAVEVPIHNDEDEEEMPEESAITIKMSWLRNIAAVAAAIIAFLMIGTPVSNSNKMGNDVQQSAFIPVSSPSHATAATAPQPAATEEASATADETANVADATNIDTNTTNATEATVDTAPHPIATPAPAEPAFCIVLASQVSKKGAESFVTQLHKEGRTEARMMVSKNNVRRVVYGSYATEAEAQADIRALRSQSRHFREAWVMKTKD